MTDLKRRRFLQAGLAVAGCFALGRDFWKRAYAAPTVIGPGPYGSLLAPDANGLLLPPGFSSRRLATAYQPIAKADGSSTSFLWHRASDGGGVIPQADGGWIYVSNSEIPIVADECADDPASASCGEQGGCSAIRFDAQGRVLGVLTAENVAEIDLILGGHDHVYEKKKVGLYLTILPF